VFSCSKFVLTLIIVLGLTGGGTWGCTERTIDDDVAQLCRTACQRDRRCDMAQEGESLDDCVQSCIPQTEKSRMRCEALFDLEHCVSALSCEDFLSYADIVARADFEIARKANYPCNDENIVYLDECLD